MRRVMWQLYRRCRARDTDLRDPYKPTDIVVDSAESVSTCVAGKNPLHDESGSGLWLGRVTLPATPPSD